MLKQSKQQLKFALNLFRRKKKYLLYSNKSYHGKLIGSGSISGSYKKNNQFPTMENCIDFNFNDDKDLEEKIKNCESSGGVFK